MFHPCPGWLWQPEGKQQQAAVNQQQQQMACNPPAALRALHRVNDESAAGHGQAPTPG